MSHRYLFGTVHQNPTILTRWSHRRRRYLASSGHRAPSNRYLMNGAPVFQNYNIVGSLTKTAMLYLPCSSEWCKFYQKRVIKKELSKES